MPVSGAVTGQHISDVQFASAYLAGDQALRVTVMPSDADARATSFEVTLNYCAPTF
jgi:hypothetical protein